MPQILKIKVMLKFSERFDEWTNNTIQDEIKKMVGEVRIQLNSKDPIKVEIAKERIQSSVVESQKDNVENLIKLYLDSDAYAEQLEKGRHNQAPSKSHHHYLRQYILEKTGETIKFPNLKDDEGGKFATVNYRGAIINYKLVNILNKFHKNYVKDFQDYYLSNYSGDEMIMIIDGKESVKFRSDMKDAVDQIQLNYLNISIMDVEEFIGWVEKN